MTQSEYNIFDDKRVTLDTIKNILMTRRLQVHGYNRVKTAESLGISVRTVRNWINDRKNKGIEIPDSTFGTTQEASDNENKDWGGCAGSI